MAAVIGAWLAGLSILLMGMDGTVPAPTPGEWLQGGGFLAFVYVVYRQGERITRAIEGTQDRLARIEEHLDVPDRKPRRRSKTRDEATTPE